MNKNPLNQQKVLNLCVLISIKFHWFNAPGILACTCTYLTKKTLVVNQPKETKDVGGPHRKDCFSRFFAPRSPQTQQVKSHNSTAALLYRFVIDHLKPPNTALPQAALLTQPSILHILGCPSKAFKGFRRLHGPSLVEAFPNGQRQELRFLERTKPDSWLNPSQSLPWLYLWQPVGLPMFVPTCSN